MQKQRSRSRPGSCSYLLREDPDGALPRARELVDARLAELEKDDQATAGAARQELKDDLALTDTRMQRVEAYLRWVFTQDGFRLDPIKRAGLAPPDLDWDGLRPSLLEHPLIGRGRRLWRRFIRALRLGSRKSAEGPDRH